MRSKHHTTKVELSQSNHSAEDSGCIPSADLLLKYVSRFQESHGDYQPIDVDSIKWLTGSLSSARLLSLGPGTSLTALTLSRGNIRYLRTLRNRIKIGKQKYANNQLERIPLITKMEWMEQFKYPKAIFHLWFDINSIIHDAQSDIPTNEYLKHSECYQRWFNLVHVSWQQILKEVRNHLFFRQFRRIEDIPRFQHSVYWTIFFYRFETDKDSGSPHIIALKDQIWFNYRLRNGIKAFIDAVETELNEVKYIEFPRMNITEDGLLRNEELNEEINEILRSMSFSNGYECWLINMFIQANDLWRITLIDSIAGELVPFPREIFAAKMLWDVEAIVAYIEPIVFKRHVHHLLLSFRRRLRSYIYQIILNESWISDI